MGPALELESHEPLGNVLIPGSRVRYLAEIAEQGRGIGAEVERQAERAATASTATRHCGARGSRTAGVLEPYRTPRSATRGGAGCPAGPVQRRARGSRRGGARTTARLGRPIAAISAETYSYSVRDREVTGENYRRSLSQQLIRRSRRPGSTGGATACGSCSRRTCLGPTRTPAACSRTGAPARTRRGCSPARGPRAHQPSLPLSQQGQPAARLSTAFDSVTLYGEDPAERADIFGKEGTRASRLPPSTTPRSCIPGLTCAPRRHRCR